MYEERDLLLDTFEAHTAPAVDTADVLAKVDEIARVRRRQRWVVQAGGASLVTAGVVAGGIVLPGALAGGNDAGSATMTAASDPSSSHTRAQELAAFFSAGYGYANAQQLAKIWHETNITNVKAEAGEKLLNGESLPLPPSGQPEAPPDRDVSAFFNAGYDYNDAVTLAGMWHTTDAYQAKVKAGQKIESGESLPIPPSGTVGTPAVSRSSNNEGGKLTRTLIMRKKGMAAPKPGDGAGGSDAMSPALTAYFDAGYDYSDAQRLAAAWHESDIGQVKAEAGQKLLDGDRLPVAPSGEPATPTDTAVETFFADGYDYNDAVTLASTWHVSVYHAKVEAGQKLENGETLPVQP